MSAPTFDLGPYTVRLGLRPDNPAFPAYLVFRGDRLIGRQFSCPSESDCQRIERERSDAEPCSARRKTRYGRNDLVRTRQCGRCHFKFIPKNDTNYCAACRPLMRKAA